MHPLLNLAINSARKAGHMIRKANEKTFKVYEKAPNNFYTDIDLQAEQIILDTIKEARPNDYFITEESGEFGNPEAEMTWIIDPIDGTTNFIHGLPQICVSIALQYRGKTEIGVIYNPNSDELFTASRGHGARLNDKKLRVATRQNWPGSVFSTSLKYDKNRMKETYIAQLMTLHRRIAGFRYSGSLALDLCYVAAGKLDGLWTATPCKIWDIAAGYLIVKEAGGVVTDLQGNPANLTDGQLIAANPKMAHRLNQLLAPHLIQ